MLRVFSSSELSSSEPDPELWPSCLVYGSCFQPGHCLLFSRLLSLPWLSAWSSFESQRLLPLCSPQRSRLQCWGHMKRQLSLRWRADRVPALQSASGHTVLRPARCSASPADLLKCSGQSCVQTVAGWGSEATPLALSSLSLSSSVWVQMDGSLLRGWVGPDPLWRPRHLVLMQFQDRTRKGTTTSICCYQPIWKRQNKELRDWNTNTAWCSLIKPRKKTTFQNSCSPSICVLGS